MSVRIAVNALTSKLVVEIVETFSEPSLFNKVNEAAAGKATIWPNSSHRRITSSCRGQAVPTEYIGIHPIAGRPSPAAPRHEA